MQMNLTRKRRVAVAAALAAAAIAVPAGSADAAPLPTLGPGVAPGLAFPAGWNGMVATGWAGTPAAGLGFVGPLVGQVAAVIGPTIITTAPSTFINTNNQVSAGGVANGGQAAGPTTGVG
jgi:hypothetical protein